MNIRFHSTLLVALAGTLLGGCGSEAAEPDRLSGVAERLIGGTPATESQFPSTVWMNGCTGTKIGPRLFMTAGHCIGDDELAPDKVPGSVQRITASNDFNEATWVDALIVKAQVHPDRVRFCPNGGPCMPDIGVVLIDRDTPEIPIASIDPTVTAKGDRVIKGGYGCEGDGQPAHRYKIGSTVVADASLAFDSPFYAGHCVITAPFGATTDSVGLCPGDSGSPLYRDEPGALWVVGVASFYQGEPPVFDAHTRVDLDSAPATFEWLRSVGATIRDVPAETRPLHGERRPIPGQIEAEDFDLGGNDVAYHDSTRLNQPGGFYRAEFVDIDETQDVGGGYNIGGILADEWLNYSVSIAQNAVYDLELRIASPVATGSLRLELDRQAVGTSITIPNTTGYQQFQTVMVPGIKLNAGDHVLRVFFEQPGFNLNWLRFTASPPSCTDGLANGAESDVDCGALCPSRCSDLQHCTTDGDCQSGYCAAATCAEKPAIGAAGSAGTSAVGGSGGAASGMSGAASTAGAVGSAGALATAGALGNPTSGGAAGDAARIDGAGDAAGCSVVPGTSSRSSFGLLGLFAAALALGFRRPRRELSQP